MEKTRNAKRPTRFSQREVGSGRPAPDADDPISKLNNTQKRYYAKMIDKRVYGSWDDVRSELTWVRGKKDKK